MVSTRKSRKIQSTQHSRHLPQNRSPGSAHTDVMADVPWRLHIRPRKTWKFHEKNARKRKKTPKMRHGGCFGRPDAFASTDFSMYYRSLSPMIEMAASAMPANFTSFHILMPNFISPNRDVGAILTRIVCITARQFRLFREGGRTGSEIGNSFRFTVRSVVSGN